MKMYMSQTSLANRYKIVKKCLQKKIKAGASDQNSNADFFKEMLLQMNNCTVAQKCN